MRTISKIQESILEIQRKYGSMSESSTDKSGTHFRGKNQKGSWSFGDAYIVSVGTEDCFVSINGNKVIEETIGVHIYGIEDKNKTALFASICDNNAGDTISSNNIKEKLNYSKKHIVCTDNKVWCKLKDNCLFYDKPQYN